MTNTPGGYRDPQGRSGSRVIGYIIGAVILLLLLAWLLGLFGADEAAEVETEGAVVTGESVEEAAEETGVAIEGAAESTEEAVEDATEGAVAD